MRISLEGSEGGGKVGMSMMDYVIGGMDRGFKRKLFQRFVPRSRLGYRRDHQCVRDDYVNRSQAA